MAESRDEFKERVKAANDIVEVISSYVPLKKRGRLWWACCPFHGEKTPSFAVNREEQYFYCYGCHEGGDVLKFVQKINNLTFPETLNELAQRANIPVPEQNRTPADAKRDMERKKILEANELAAKYFASCLKNTPFGATVRKYLNARGISDAIIETFSLGAALPAHDNLIFNLKRRGVTTEILLKAGLARQRNGARLTDAFYRRAMIPIKDARGRVVAFGGRVLDSSEPKYLNTGETELFQKRELLFGLDIAIKSIREKREAIVVEGYMDAISLHAAGVNRAVASLGTAFSAEQARLLHRLCERIVISYDSDDAGKRNAVRAVSIAKAEGINAAVLTVPEVKDPDEYVRRYGCEAFERLTANAVDGTEFQIRYTLEKNNPATYAEKVAVVPKVLPYILECRSDLLAQNYLVRLSQWLTLDESLLREAYAKARRSYNGNAENGGEANESVRKFYGGGRNQKTTSTSSLYPEFANMDLTDRAERKLIALMLVSPGRAKEYDSELREAGLANEARKIIWRQILAQPSGSLQTIRERVLELGDKKVTAEFMSIVDTEMDTQPGQMENSARDCLLVLQREALEREIIFHQLQADKLMRKGDDSYLEELKLAEAAQKRKQELNA